MGPTLKMNWVNFILHRLDWTLVPLKWRVIPYISSSHYCMLISWLLSSGLLSFLGVGQDFSRQIGEGEGEPHHHCRILFSSCSGTYYHTNHVDSLFWSRLPLAASEVDSVLLIDDEVGIKDEEGVVQKERRHYQKVGSEVVVPAPVVPCHGVEKSSSWKSNQSSKTKIIVKNSSLLTMQLCKYPFQFNSVWFWMCEMCEICWKLGWVVPNIWM